MGTLHVGRLPSEWGHLGPFIFLVEVVSPHAPGSADEGLCSWGLAAVEPAVS